MVMAEKLVKTLVEIKESKPNNIKKKKKKRKKKKDIRMQ